MKYDDRGDDNISPHDIKPLQVLADEKILKRFLCVSLEPRVRRIGVVDIVPYKEFLDKLWNGDFS